MQKIKINSSNEEKIIKTINNSQKKCSARIVNYEDVTNLVSFANKKLNIFPKRLWKDVSASYAELIGCKAYSRKSFSATTTEIFIQSNAKGEWFLTSCDRISINPEWSGSSQNINFSSSPSINEIKNKVFKNFCNN